jgi:NAD(P)-dependent dehydrogenase (short-subunit alcohol dehydrogenase family)
MDVLAGASEDTMGALEGRVALVTGASRGIGKAIAERFAAEGARVVAVARNAGALAHLEAAVRARGHACFAEALDLGDLAALERMVERVGDRFGKLDILIGNAAIFPGHHLVQDIPLDAMREAMHVNFVSNWWLLRQAHHLLVRSSAGRVVFVTARGAYGGHPEWSAYAATKAALDRVMAAYASENEASAIRCNSLSPGPVLTDMGLFANKGEAEGMVSADEILPLVLALVSSELEVTGKMFDYRDFPDLKPEEPWLGVFARHS